MENFNGSGSGKERKTSRNKPQDFTEILSQIRMMSDSLAACSQMSKHQQHRKMSKINHCSNTENSEFSPIPSISAENKILDGNHTGRSTIDFCIQKADKNGKIPYKRISEKESPIHGRDLNTKYISDEELRNDLANKIRQKLAVLKSLSKEFKKKTNSEVDMYNDRNVNSEQMISLIQMELKTLMKLSPSSTDLVIPISDIMEHYKSCSKCKNKISHAFPWILNRLKKLIKFIVIKQRGTYIWPNNYSYLQILPDKPSTTDKSQEKLKTVDDTEDKDSFKSENTKLLPVKKIQPSKEKQVVQFEQLEKVDPLVFAGSNPGVQLFLQVKSRRSSKRFFRRVSLKFFDSPLNQYPVVHFKESFDIPIFWILRHKPELKIRFNEKRVVSVPKLVSDKIFLKYKLPSLSQTLNSTPAAWGRITLFRYDRVRKKKIFLNRLKFTDLSDYANEEPTRPITYFKKNILMKFSELVFDIMADGEEEKMQMQKLRELEAEIKQLKSLMLGIRRNQAELNKILFKKGIFSGPLIRFVGAEILQEEDWFIDKMDEIDLEKARTSSMEDLQKIVGNLIKKCGLKNRLLVTLIKGFESKVPEEWWHEIANLMFSNPNEEENLNDEKVCDLVRKASLFTKNKEKALAAPPQTEWDENLSMEEPFMKGKMGADVLKNVKILSDLDGNWTKIMDNVLFPPDCQFPMSIFAYPASVPENLNSSIKKLEYQISVLNVENERIWHEILDLRDSLKNSVEGLKQKKSLRALNKDLPPAKKSNKKTINITIQLASDKERGTSANSKTLKITKVDEIFNRNDEEKFKSSAPAKLSSENFFSDSREKFDSEEIFQDRKIAILTNKFSSKSGRRRSINDFNHLDDFSSPGVSPYQQNEEKIKTLLGENASSPSIRKIMTNSEYSEKGTWKNIQPVQSVHMVNEATISYLSRPSRKLHNVDSYLQSPLGMDLKEGYSDGALLSVSKERELHPIPEDDDDEKDEDDFDFIDLDSGSSKNTNKAIQYLRGKIRSMHKDLMVLKLKNDRIDKVLNKVLEDIKPSCNKEKPLYHKK